MTKKTFNDSLPMGKVIDLMGEYAGYVAHRAVQGKGSLGVHEWLEKYKAFDLQAPSEQVHVSHDFEEALKHGFYYTESQIRLCQISTTGSILVYYQDANRWKQFDVITEAEALSAFENRLPTSPQEAFLPILRQ
jgi:hypothetical protein